MNELRELIQSMKLRSRTGLAVGLSVPEDMKAYMGGEWREIRAADAFQYQDGQFSVVVMAGTALNAKSAKEAHRVLKDGGCLLFTVPERTSSQFGFTLADIYSIVREGYNITVVKRPAWWRFGRGGKTLTICAQKKSWKVYKGFKREGAFCLSPFHNAKI